MKLILKPSMLWSELANGGSILWSMMTETEESTKLSADAPLAGELTVEGR